MSLKLGNLPEQFVYISLNVALIATVISVFFFTFASNIEGQIVEEQTRIVANSFTKGSSIFIDRETAKTIADELVAPDLTNDDLAAEMNNQTILLEAIKIVGIFLGVVVALAALILWWFKISPWVVIGSAVVMTLIAALTEITFLLLITRNYIIADIPRIRRHLFDALKQSLN